MSAAVSRAVISTHGRELAQAFTGARLQSEVISSSFVGGRESHRTALGISAPRAVARAGSVGRGGSKERVEDCTGNHAVASFADPDVVERPGVAHAPNPTARPLVGGAEKDEASVTG